MHVDLNSTATNAAMLIQEVQVSTGQLSARIDVYYVYMYELQDFKTKCEQTIPADDEVGLATCHALYLAIDPTSPAVGRATFTLIKGHDKLH